jgi:glycosyltransferase involved in cell wall biosynthesis
MPRLAVLIPAFDNQARLELTLASIRDEQEPFDVVVVDDGSPTPLHTPAQLGSHAVRLQRLARNGGVEAALNAGLELVLRDGYAYVAILHVGDISLAGRFAAQVAYLDAHPDIGLLGTGAEIVAMDGTLLFTQVPPRTAPGIARALRYNSCIVHPTMMMRTATLRELGLYCADYPGAEDYELLLRFARRNRVAGLPQVYVRYELNPAGISGSRRRELLRSRIRLEWRYFDPHDVHSYLGILANLGVMALPNRLLVAVKRRLVRVPV